jgi:alpha-tubulin suppressor-like RCC1 family protein
MLVGQMWTGGAAAADARSVEKPADTSGSDAGKASLLLNGMAASDGPPPTAENVVKLGHGAFAKHICAVLDTGSVMCSGWNVVGQLGVGDTNDRMLPAAMTNITDAVDVAVGQNFTCVLRSNKRVRCVGAGGAGQLGNGTLTDSTVPTDVLNSNGTGYLGAVTSLAVGDVNACATAEGQVYCWGTFLSRIGFDPITSTLPVLKTGINDAISIAVADDAACFVNVNGNVKCWGTQAKGRLGNGVVSNNLLLTPTLVLDPSGTGPLANVESVRGGVENFCAVLKDGRYVCWGDNYYGVLGNGSIDVSQSVPTPTAPTMTITEQPLTGIVMSGIGKYHNCALSDAGYVYCTGSDYDNAQGTGNVAETPTSRAVTLTESLGGPPMSDVVEIAAYADASCARKSTGDVYCWGNNNNGQLGVDNTSSQLSPVHTYGMPGAPNPLVVLEAAGSTGFGSSEVPYPVTPAVMTDVLHYTTTVANIATLIGLPTVAEDPNGHEHFTATLMLADGSILPTMLVTGPWVSLNNAVAYSDGVLVLFSLDVGITGTVTLTTYDAQGANPLVYTVLVDRLLPDATLSGLAIAPGTLTPAFVSTTTSYMAEVPNGTTSAAVTATTSDVSATVAYASTAGACAGSDCPIDASGTTTITITITAADLTTTETYTIVVTVAEPADMTTIDRVWPGTGLEAGGMPVQIFGTGFAAALTVTVDGVSVPFTIVNDGRIDFVMPPGTAGESVDVVVATADSSVTAEDAFTYVAPDVIAVDGEVGGVFTTTDGVVVTIPPQGVSGSFYLTMTPQPPAPGVPGNILMYAFRLDAVWNGIELATLTNPVTITLPIDEGIFAIQDGERPWLYQWVGREGRGEKGEERGKSGEEREEERSALTSHSSPLTSLSAGRWVLVRGQQYDAGTQRMTVALRPMGEYALSTAYLRSYWLPVVPVVK